MSKDTEHGDQTAARQPAAARPDPTEWLGRANQRKLAKAGVLVSMGVLLWSGMQRPRRPYMGMHSWAGLALIGFTLWHWSLYGPRPDRRRLDARGPSPAAPDRLPPVED